MNTLEVLASICSELFIAYELKQHHIHPSTMLISEMCPFAHSADAVVEDPGFKLTGFCRLIDLVYVSIGE
jgi:hypothetical protein